MAAARTVSPASAPYGSRGRTVLVVADIAVKVALVVLLVIATVFPDLGNLKGKASGARLVAYPIATLVVPLGWWLRALRRRRRGTDAGPFPWAGDLLISLPWFLDTLGNRLNLFDTIGWFDKFMHGLNWALLTAGVLVLSTHGIVRGRVLVERALAFGVTSAVLWELAEYVAFIRHSPELTTAYTDTLGDLAMGSCGALIAALIVLGMRRCGLRSRHIDPARAAGSTS